MKKVTALALLLGCLIAFGACDEVVAENTDESTNESTNAQTNVNAESEITTPYFCGKVLEIYEDQCLMEITDGGNHRLVVGDRLLVNYHVEGAPEISVGDHLRVVFDGKIALSYPGQILNVFEIRKIG